jgi:hypothetical protein
MLCLGKEKAGASIATVNFLHILSIEISSFFKNSPGKTKGQP